MRAYIHSIMTDRCHGLSALIMKPVLTLLSYVYGFMLRAARSRALKKSRKVPVKVISVGNITVGGTGKTSLVACIVRYLAGRGRKVAVLTRGYKSRPAQQASADEPKMLGEMLAGIPVIVNADRIEAAGRAYHDHGVDTVVLDDGFQQWRLAKDLEIVTVDSLNPFGNGHLLPRGILREGPHALKRADIIVLTKVNLCGNVDGLRRTLQERQPSALIVQAEHRPAGFYCPAEGWQIKGPDVLREKRAVIFSGIGDPLSFRRLVEKLDITVAESVCFDDHHWFTDDDLRRVISIGKEKNADVFITTRKDAVRIEERGFSFGEPPLYVLAVELVITDNEERFYNRLRDLYAV